MRQTLTCLLVLLGWQIGVGSSEAAPLRAESSVDIGTQLTQLSDESAGEPMLLARHYRRHGHCGPSYYGRRHYSGYGHGGYYAPRRARYYGHHGHHHHHHYPYPHYHGSGLGLYIGF